jgi:hypothetical protein
MTIEERIKELEYKVADLKRGQRDFLTTRIEERDVRIEGVLGIRTIKMYTGGGVPLFGASDGSIFLRNDGTAENTLYIREGGVWRAANTLPV